MIGLSIERLYLMIGLKLKSGFQLEIREMRTLYFEIHKTDDFLLNLAVSWELVTRLSRKTYENEI